MTKRMKANWNTVLEEVAKIERRQLLLIVGDLNKHVMEKDNQRNSCNGGRMAREFLESGQ